MSPFARFVVVIVVCVTGTAIAGGASPAAFGFSSGARPVDAVAANGGSLSARGCAACHKDVVDDWGSSRHAVAFSNSVFLDGLRREPRARCVHCHAPLREQRDELGPIARAPTLAPTSTSLLHEGVTCAACHVRDGAVLVAKAVVRRDRDMPLHDVVVTPALRDPTFCASCHQFGFTNTSTQMQGTYDEWRRYADGGGAGTCQSCHMPGGRHLFRGAWDVDLLRRSLVVDVVALAGALTSTQREVSLRSRDVGHSFPTGDLFRHLTLEAQVDDNWIDVATFGRSFGNEGRSKQLIADTSLQPGQAQTKTLPARSTAWRVRYHYALARHEDSGVVAPVVLAGGDLR